MPDPLDFDTEAYAEQLKAAKIAVENAKQQAAAIAGFVDEKLTADEGSGELAAKQGMKELALNLGNDIDKLESNMKNDLQTLESNLNNGMRELKSNLKQGLKMPVTELKKEIQKLNAEIKFKSE